MSRKTKEEVVEEFRCASIQDAAMRVIARKGVDETTIQDVADEAGIAKGTVYVYFRDREELFARTADRAFEMLVAKMEPVFDVVSSFADKLTRVVTTQLRFFDENRALFRATLALSQKDASHKKKSPSFGRYMTRLEQMFADAHASGELRRDLDPQALAAVYRDCVRGVILRRLELTKPKTSPDDDARLIVSILLHGIQSGDQ
ncbi:MAG TPA: TetR/AcrR family transcriptional regulator [Thermoanaerobaculia bacterium]|nr:TetR/AcrR family transcriptional regulator [Thermoanaerobaculia bacterium]